MDEHDFGAVQAALCEAAERKASREAEAVAANDGRPVRWVMSSGFDPATRCYVTRNVCVDIETGAPVELDR